MSEHDPFPLFRITAHVSAPDRRSAFAAFCEHVLSSYTRGSHRVAHGVVHHAHIRAVFQGSELHRANRMGRR